MKFSKFSELVNRILSNNHSHRRDMDVTIVIHSPGSIGSTPSVEVQSIHAGFDWDSGKVLIFPAQPLTTLTPEQITDITDSVRKGQSWHAYQEYKKHKEQLEKLSIELDAAKQRVAELEAKPVSQTYKLTFEQWLEQQHDKIDVDCGCVSTEMFMHWIRVAYEAGNSPVTPDGHVQFSVSLPAAFGGDKYFIDGVFQPLRYERDCERAVVAAGGVVSWVK
ncbi:TPA: DUF551 domain-containing protein [Escherichia coli]|jgi:hypothetical protein|uniref:DUF551 domain-containing protein n=2 Tax=Escherichia TaxID=561 RepID=A0A418GE93_ECOLX|nr:MULTISPECIES: hypothetical protein [Enterobacteriaceae]AUO37509.1 pmgU domain protein [Escherichia phage YDC107_1]EHJ4142159.1 DUF551 domain-containing protein [Escherichia fergusonii]EID4856362.1 DUF551 domain-containing protein [Salmonella enterica]MED9031521.1 DUF551 domain-containing protein [Escherichia marmotae]HAI1411704.1 DUF551 domain-containing protein [Escherichia coli O25b:H4-ST131]